MTKLEMLLSEYKAKRTECLRQVGLLQEKASTYREIIDSLDTAVHDEAGASEPKD
jgi:hypothetical protein